jgi:hypothetical protein
MHTASVVQSYSGHQEFYTTLLEEDGISACFKNFGPRQGKEVLTIDHFVNIADIRFVITSELDKSRNHILKGCGKRKNSFTENLFCHKSLSSKTQLSRYLRDYFINNEGIDIWNQMIQINTMYEFGIVRAVTYEGSGDSDVGKGVIYAMPDTKNNVKRYDYVNVKVEYQNDQGEDIEGYQAAQVLSIIQKHSYTTTNENKRDDSTEWFFIVQYMNTINVEQETSQPHSCHEYISVLEWETIRDGNTIKYNIQMISLDNIIGSAMVIPYFSFIEKKKSTPGKTIGTPILGSPSRNDKFWYVDRKFFDRSGWNELEVYKTMNVNDVVEQYLKKNIIDGVENYSNIDDDNLEEQLSDDNDEY